MQKLIYLFVACLMTMVVASCGNATNSSDTNRVAQQEDSIKQAETEVNEKNEKESLNSIRDVNERNSVDQETLAEIEKESDYRNSTTVWQDGPLKVTITLANGEPKDASLELRNYDGELLSSGSLMENCEIRKGKVFYGESYDFVGCVMINLETGKGIVKSRLYTDGEITNANFKRIK